MDVEWRRLSSLDRSHCSLPQSPDPLVARLSRLTAATQVGNFERFRQVQTLACLVMALQVSAAKLKLSNKRLSLPDINRASSDDLKKS